MSLFEIRRLDSTGAVKVSHLSNASEALRVFSIAGILDSDPKIFYKGKEIAYINLVEMLKAERRVSDDGIVLMNRQQLSSSSSKKNHTKRRIGKNAAK